jgi:hypothetical protein
MRMKTLQLSLGIFIIALSVLTIAPAHAGGRDHYSHFGGFHPGHGHRHHHWSGYHRRHDYRRGYKHGRRHHHHHDAGYLLGGIVIGSLISQAYHHNDGHSTHRYYHSGNYAGRTESRVVYRTAEPVDYREQESAIPRHILLRDRDGRCFTVTETDAGTELRTEIDAGACERD